MKIKNNKGFTLIELLIVVAIIAILAAIAIPQFSAYRIKGYNATALSDLRNMKTAQESLYADMTAYGVADGGAVGVALDAVPAAAGGGIVPGTNTWNGPLAGAVGGGTPVNGARIAGINASGSGGFVSLGVSNGVNLGADCSVDGLSAPVAGAYNSYVAAARHDSGDTAYSADSDNAVAVFRASNSQWTAPSRLNTVTANVPAATFGADDINNKNANGVPTANWTMM